MPAHEEPVLFLWSLSPWASKVVAYLALRGIPHARCEQPITQPRPDLAALGVDYRRIPVLSIGRDIYCDTLLILEKLEEIYPADSEYESIGAKSEDGTAYALEKLLEKWTDTVVFKPAAAAIPSELDLMKDPQFQKDREELWGRPWSKEEQDALRPKGLADLRANFDLLETTLADGREWITGGTECKLADIHACWIFSWLLQISAYDPTFFNKQKYPKTLAYLERYDAAIARARETVPAPTELSGDDAVGRILRSGFQDQDSELGVEADPEGFRRGEAVEMWPVDTGYTRKDGGELVKLTAREAVVQTSSPGKEGKEVRVHYPRWNFLIRRTAGGVSDGGGGKEGTEDGEFVTLN